jgi:hypothetical protein
LVAYSCRLRQLQSQVTSGTLNVNAGCVMNNELERGLNRVLEEHQHESGLHMIGGRRRLVDRLMQFLEEQKAGPEKSSKSAKEREN